MTETQLAATAKLVEALPLLPEVAWPHAWEAVRASLLALGIEEDRHPDTARGVWEMLQSVGVVPCPHPFK